MISIIIPAYQEESRIGKSLEKIFSFFQTLNDTVEVIVVDDGSRDNTSVIASSFPDVKLLRNKTNFGKGFSVRRGMLEAKGDIILFTDADLSTPIEEYIRLRKYIRKYDVIIASRAMKDSILLPPQPFSRRFLGQCFAFIREVILPIDIRDSQCGFKIFTRAAAHEIFKKSLINGFSFDVELLFISRLCKLSILEIPVTWKNSHESKVSPFKDVWRMFFDIINIRWNAYRGKYN